MTKTPLNQIKRKMKLTGLLVLITCLHVSAAGYSQRITILDENISLGQVFKKIEKQTDFLFWYESSLPALNKTVSLKIRNATIQETMNFCLNKTGLTYKIMGKTIVVRQAEEAGVSADVLQTDAPKTTISGKVVSNEGAPLEGVSVRVKGTTGGTVTKEGGEYSLTVTAQDKILLFSYVGMEPQEVAINGRTVINVTLQTIAVKAEEIIITGYQEIKGRNFPGAVSKLLAKDIPPVAAPSIDQMIQGKVAGLQVVNNSGDPSEMGLTLIRGRSGLHDNSYLNRPLYVVDGFILSDDMINTINPNDIESIEVLRDAGATAIYGARGGNGVFVITTRKAKAGNIRVDYNGSWGLNLVPDLTKRYMNTEEKIAFEMATNGFASRLSPEQRDSLAAINTNWQNYILHQGITSNQNVSIGGGSEKSSYGFSLGYQDNEGTVKNTFFKRYSGLFRLNSVVSRYFNFNLRLQGAATRGGAVLNNFSSTGSPLKVLAYANPYETPYNAQGAIKERLNNGLPNPLNEIDKARIRSNTNMASISARAEFQVPHVEGLKLFTNVTGSYTISGNENKYWPGSYQTNFSNKSQIDFTENKITNVNATSAISYNRVFSHDHDLTAALFYEFRNSRADGLNYRVYGFNALVPNLASVPITTDNISILRNMGSESAISSYFMNINYAYKRRYNLQLTGRRDGSSLFGERKQFGWFGAVAGMWDVTSEAFMKPLNKQVSMLRLRASLGNAGDMVGIGNQAAFDKIEIQTYNDQSAYVLSGLANKEVSWAERKKLNFGLDLGLFQSRLTANFNVYSETIDNAFVQVPIPPSSGFGIMSRNLAGIKNRGIEVELKGDLVRKKHIEWTVSGNFAHNQNRVTSLQSLEAISYIGGITKVGYPFRSMYVINYMGVDPQTGAPLYEGADGKPIPTLQYSTYARIHGPVDAPYFGGFSNYFRYKSWGLRANFVYNIGNDVINVERYYDENTIDLSYNQAKVRKNFWKGSGDSTAVLPKPGGYEINRYTDRYLESGSFTRLKLVQLEYRLPEDVLKRLRLSDVNVYLAGTNLFVFTKFTGTDPEFVDGVLQGGQYPVQKTITLGLNVRF